QHIGVFGRTGSGKTNLGYLMLQQLQKHGKPFLVFDWKRNYRDLLALPEFQKVEVYTVGRTVSPFRFNPLIPPPGIPPKTWLKKIIEVIAHAYLLGNGVLYLLQESVDAVYRECGLYSGHMTRIPKLRDVLETARKRDTKGREAGWWSSLMRALSSLCFGDMDELINTEENGNIDDLLRKPVVLELESLTQSDKVFLIQALLLWIHHRRMTQGEREHFRHAILIEEAHHVLTGERRSLVGGQSIMEITCREIREFGESLIILDQHPSMISLPALGNTHATLCLNLKHSKDVSAMGQAMLLDPKEREILGTLEVGKAVVKLQGRGTKPFLIEIPEFPLTKGMLSDEDVAKRMGRETSPSLTVPPTPSPIPVPVSPPAPLEAALDNLALIFLKDIADHPDSGVANRYKRMGISVRQGQKLKARLVEEGLIEDRLETTEKGTKRVVRLTRLADQAVGVETEA
ncbi:MAG: DUF87 domain-containing protein, partial [Candidatus Omnitrophica bacterium]|nr:DUF87 domain-containing protein [Candidatus Omnitrophota bacterium]